MQSQSGQYNHVKLFAHQPKQLEIHSPGSFPAFPLNEGVNRSEKWSLALTNIGYRQARRGNDFQLALHDLRNYRVARGEILTPKLFSKSPTGDVKRMVFFVQIWIAIKANEFVGYSTPSKEVSNRFSDKKHDLGEIRFRYKQLFTNLTIVGNM